LVEGYSWEKVKDRLPYTLKLVNRSGTTCSACIWSKNCRGCDVQINNNYINIKDRQTIAITWNRDTIKDHFSENKTKEIIQDKSYFVLRSKEKEPIDLTTCIQEYTSKERLDGEDLWYCSTCKEHQTSVKKIDLWKLPPIVILHLKRFEQLRHGLVKIDRLVQFSCEGFDFTPFVPDQEKENAVYQLYACLNHYGNLGSGHYTTYALNEQKWYCFDDGRCFLIDDHKSIESSAAYLLFLVRKDFTGIDLSSIKTNPATNASSCVVM